MMGRPRPHQSVLWGPCCAYNLYTHAWGGFGRQGAAGALMLGLNCPIRPAPEPGPGRLRGQHALLPRLGRQGRVREEQGGHGRERRLARDVPPQLQRMHRVREGRRRLLQREPGQGALGAGGGAGVPGTRCAGDSSSLLHALCGALPVSCCMPRPHARCLLAGCPACRLASWSMSPRSSSPSRTWHRPRPHSQPGGGGRAVALAGLVVCMT